MLPSHGRSQGFKSLIAHHRDTASRQYLRRVFICKKALFYRIFDRASCFSIVYSYFLLFVYLALYLTGFELMPFLTFGFPTYCSVGVNLDYLAKSSFYSSFFKIITKSDKNDRFTPAAVVLYCMVYFLISLQFRGSSPIFYTQTLYSALKHFILRSTPKSVLKPLILHSNS